MEASPTYNGEKSYIALRAKKSLQVKASQESKSKTRGTEVFVFSRYQKWYC